jgi:hypothetical protein
VSVSGEGGCHRGAEQEEWEQFLHVNLAESGHYTSTVRLFNLLSEPAVQNANALLGQ